MLKSGVLAGMLAIFCGLPSIAALPQQEGLAERLHRLEAETQALRDELQWMRENPVRLPSVNATPVGYTQASYAPAETDYFTFGQLKEEMKKLAWTKGDTQIIPYGYLWGNAVYETERSVVGPYTLFVESATRQGEDAFYADGRNSRLGFDVLGPKVPFFGCARSGGKIEFDFQGDINGTENKGGVLLRHAYAEVKDERFRLLIGQTWDVVSPLYPGTLMYSVGWGGGNIGYRRGQLRLERFLDVSDTTLLTLQGSLNQNVFLDRSLTRRAEASGWPLLEARAAITQGYRGKGGLPITLGFSGHVGEQGLDQLDVGGVVLVDDVRRKTWSFNVDLRAPITERLGFQGEFFTGANLGTFLGGVIQGINPVTLEPIRSSGGWFELWYDWTPKLHSHFGYAVDDPNDNDIAAGGRTYNHFYYANLSYDLTKKFLMGVEVSSWKTLYAGGLAPGESIRTEVMARYAF